MTGMSSCLPKLCINVRQASLMPIVLSEKRIIHQPRVASKIREKIFTSILSVSTGPLPCSICTQGILQKVAQSPPKNERRKNRVLVMMISGFSFFIYESVFQNERFQNFGKGKCGTISKLGSGMIVWWDSSLFPFCPMDDVTVVTSQNPHAIQAFAHSDAWLSSHHLCGGK